MKSELGTKLVKRKIDASSRIEDPRLAENTKSDPNESQGEGSDYAWHVLATCIVQVVSA